jgi:hypothetical protein
LRSGLRWYDERQSKDGRGDTYTSSDCRSPLPHPGVRTSRHGHGTRLLVDGACGRSQTAFSIMHKQRDAHTSMSWHAKSQTPWGHGAPWSDASATRERRAPGGFGKRVAGLICFRKLCMGFFVKIEVLRVTYRMTLYQFAHTLQVFVWVHHDFQVVV